MPPNQMPSSVNRENDSFGRTNLTRRAFIESDGYQIYLDSLFVNEVAQVVESLLDLEHYSGLNRVMVQGGHLAEIDALRVARIEGGALFFSELSNLQFALRRARVFRTVRFLELTGALDPHSLRGPIALIGAGSVYEETDGLGLKVSIPDTRSYRDKIHRVSSSLGRDESDFEEYEDAVLAVKEEVQIEKRDVGQIYAFEPNVDLLQVALRVRDLAHTTGNVFIQAHSLGDLLEHLVGDPSHQYSLIASFRTDPHIYSGAMEDFTGEVDERTFGAMPKIEDDIDIVLSALVSHLRSDGQLLLTVGKGAKNLDEFEFPRRTHLMIMVGIILKRYGISCEITHHELSWAKIGGQELSRESDYLSLVTAKR